MVTRRLVFITSIVATALSSFTLGVVHTRYTDAIAQESYDEQIASLRAEMRTQLGKVSRADAVNLAGTAGTVAVKSEPATNARAKMVAEIDRKSVV